MAFQVSDRRVGYILNKNENATPELFAIYMQLKQMKVYLNVQRLGCALRCCHEETHESHLNVTGVQFFRLQI